MSLTLLAWLATFAALTGLAFRRPVYGVSLYLFTFFISPAFWWWGGPVRSWRWNLAAGLILLATVLLNRSTDEGERGSPTKVVGVLALLMAANALFVHFTLAPEREVSSILLILLLKFVLLYFLMLAAIRSPEDLRVVLWSVIVFAAYIGYEVMFNGRGNFSGGRLEGIGAAGVQNSNELASLLLAVIPFGGYLFLTGTPREKVLAAITTPLTLNVLLLCNSRGAFLGLMAAAPIVLVLAPKGARAMVLKGVALGSLALVLLLGDPRIMERFMTVFVSAEERDGSVEARTLIWRAAINQIKDHPLGAGGQSFSGVYGRHYLPGVGYDSDGRAVHNGYLNEITNWGFQGLFLRLALVFLAFRAALRAGRRCGRLDNSDGALLAACLVSATVGTLVTAIFGDYLDDEHLIWLVALMVIHHRVYAEGPAALSLPVPQAGAPVASPTAAAAESVPRPRRALPQPLRGAAGRLERGA